MPTRRPSRQNISTTFRDGVVDLEETGDLLRARMGVDLWLSFCCVYKMRPDLDDYLTVRIVYQDC